MLIERRDTRNSQEMIEFLDLDEFAPEILIQKPLLITKWNCNYEMMSGGDSQNAQYHVTHCQFLPKHNLFILALNTASVDKKGKKWKGPSFCKFQIFSFKQLSQVRDSFILKHGDAHIL